MKNLSRAILLMSASAALLSGRAAQAQQVYIGSGNGWSAMIAHPEQWDYVRKHANGFYINFIQLLNSSSGKCAQTSALFSHKNAYYESDSRYTGLGGFPDGGQFSRALETQELSYLLQGGFKVPYASLNYGLDPAKQHDLQHQGLPAGETRPVLAQCGPWTFGGDIKNDSASSVGFRAEIAKAAGASTDGPMSLWQANTGQMQSGSISLIKYVHAQGKLAVAMVAPYNLQPTSQWLKVAQGCVRAHEDAGAVPNIWDVFEYATSTPTLPETVNGQPADTITGMAYWLLYHLNDPLHWERLVAPSSVGRNGRVAFHIPSVINGEIPAQTISLELKNSSSWLDLCPALTARRVHMNGWSVRFMINGKDVTSAMTQGGGLSCVGPLRLWPGQHETLDVVIRCVHPYAALGKSGPVLSVIMRPNPNPATPVEQTVALRPIAVLG